MAAIVHVQFINAATKAVVAVSDMPAAQLPDTFAVNTTLEINGQKWSVLSATPVDKTNFIRTGNLQISMAPVIMASPKDLLYSLPTISDDLGAIAGNEIPSPEIFSIHEDDWRQVEFVSIQFDQAINQEFADIRGVYAQKIGQAFKALHVRKRIPHPLTDIQLTLSELKSCFNPIKTYKEVGLLKTKGAFVGSFAFGLEDGCVIWGASDEKGEVVCLNFFGAPRKDAVPISAELASLANKHQLYLIDWCRLAKVKPEPKDFEKYFAAISTQ